VPFEAPWKQYAKWGKEFSKFFVAREASTSYYMFVWRYGNERMKGANEG
jgi:hypothetical protein